MLDVTSLPDKAPDFDLQELFGAGMHYGHHKSKWQPRMIQYIHSEKNGVHIIDLAKTAQQMRLAYNLLYQLGAQKKSVIIIGTKRQARELVKQAAETSGMMHITSRWLGGLMTNWSQVKKSLKDMVDTEAKLAEGSLKGRTKYELVKIEKEVARAKRFF
jgi:small subunit ribosomal protein S2